MTANFYSLYCLPARGDAEHWMYIGVHFGTNRESTDRE